MQSPVAYLISKLSDGALIGRTRLFQSKRIYSHEISVICKSFQVKINNFSYDIVLDIPELQSIFIFV